jgi:hypothetical protein
MRTMRFTLAIAIACALSAPPPTFAESEVTLPRERHRGAVTWISGGIGKAQADAMRGIASRYDVRLVMAQARKPRAAFLALVPVKIRDAKGRMVLDIQTEGPFLFLKLPPGRYTVSAVFADHVVSKSLRVRRGASVETTLIWPSRPGEY